MYDFFFLKIAFRDPEMQLRQFSETTTKRIELFTFAERPRFRPRVVSEARQSWGYCGVPRVSRPAGVSHRLPDGKRGLVSVLLS